MKYSLKKKANYIIKMLIILIMAVFLENKSNQNLLNVYNSNLYKKINLNSLAFLDIPQSIEVSVSKASEKTLEENQESIPVVDNLLTDVEENTQFKTQDNSTDNLEISSSNVLATYTGNMTGYVYNCPGCSGKLACNSSLDLSNGNVTYYDATYGTVNIVAASTNLECGSIVSINSSMSETPMLAIVLDRGVKGTTLDLLTPSVDYAINNVGNKQITYDLLRSGY